MLVATSPVLSTQVITFICDTVTITMRSTQVLTFNADIRFKLTSWLLASAAEQVSLERRENELKKLTSTYN
jgi:hypothetical protein